MNNKAVSLIKEAQKYWLGYVGMLKWHNRGVRCSLYVTVVKPAFEGCFHDKWQSLIANVL